MSNRAIHKGKHDLPSIFFNTKGELDSDVGYTEEIIEELKTGGKAKLQINTIDLSNPNSIKSISTPTITPTQDSVMAKKSVKKPNSKPAPIINEEVPAEVFEIPVTPKITKAQVPEPEIQVDFSGNFGDITDYCHSVVIQPKIIVLIKDFRYKGGSYNPPSGQDNNFSLNIYLPEGHHKFDNVINPGIKFRLDAYNLELRILLYAKKEHSD